MSAPFDAIVIGGGFYGLSVALHLRTGLGLRRVAVLEKEPEFMSRASYVNQARVHRGYHYPRSILTAYRSQVNLPSFIDDYREAVVDDFTHYYAIARALSQTNARQFEAFSRRIGAPIDAAPPAVAALFDPSRIDGVFEVSEPAFDSRILRSLLLDRILAEPGIELMPSTEAQAVRPGPGGSGEAGRSGGPLTVETDAGTLSAPIVISAAYSRINVLHRASGLATIPVQHELTEMPLVSLPQELRGAAFTVMDGPFFSMMPFPDRGLHTLSHVRYTPHHRWTEGDAIADAVAPALPAVDPWTLLEQVRERTAFDKMKADVLRYMPGLGALAQRDSVREVKTVLMKSKHDDSRPILFRADHGLPGYTCIMGAKIDNIYDVFQELGETYG